MFEHIIVPLDGSRLSAQALPFATELAHRFHSKILLVRVIPETNVTRVPQRSDIGDRRVVNIISEQMPVKDVENSANAKRYLMNRAKELHDQGIDVSYYVMEGTPACSIMEFSKKQNAPLVVMMSHGRGRFKRAILGSVTDALIRSGSVPVLVISPKDTKK